MDLGVREEFVFAIEILQNLLGDRVRNAGAFLHDVSQVPSALQGALALGTFDGGRLDVKDRSSHGRPCKSGYDTFRHIVVQAVAREYRFTNELLEVLRTNK